MGVDRRAWAGRCGATVSRSPAASRPFRGSPARRPSTRPRPSKVRLRFGVSLRIVFKLFVGFLFVWFRRQGCAPSFWWWPPSCWRGCRCWCWRWPTSSSSWRGSTGRRPIGSTWPPCGPCAPAVRPPPWNSSLSHFLLPSEVGGSFLRTDTAVFGVDVEIVWRRSLAGTADAFPWSRSEHEDDWLECCNFVSRVFGNHKGLRFQVHIPLQHNSQIVKTIFTAILLNFSPICLIWPTLSCGGCFGHSQGSPQILIDSNYYADRYHLPDIVWNVQPGHPQGAAAVPELAGPATPVRLFIAAPAQLALVQLFRWVLATTEDAVLLRTKHPQRWSVTTSACGERASHISFISNVSIWPSIFFSRVSRLVLEKSLHQSGSGHQPWAVFSSFSLANFSANLKVFGPWLVSGPSMANQSLASWSLAKELAKLKEEAPCCRGAYLSQSHLAVRSVGICIPSFTDGHFGYVFFVSISMFVQHSAHETLIDHVLVACRTIFRTPYDFVLFSFCFFFLCFGLCFTVVGWSCGAGQSRVRVAAAQDGGRTGAAPGHGRPPKTGHAPRRVPQPMRHPEIQSGLG